VYDERRVTSSFFVLFLVPPHLIIGFAKMD